MTIPKLLLLRSILNPKSNVDVKVGVDADVGDVMLVLMLRKDGFLRFIDSILKLLIMFILMLLLKVFHLTLHQEGIINFEKPKRDLILVGVLAEFIKNFK